MIPEERDLPGGRFLQRRQHLLSEIAREPGSQRPAVLRRPLNLILLGAVLVTLMAGASYLASRPTSDPFSVGCYDGLDQQADTMILAFKGNGSLGAAGICAKEWQAQGHEVSQNLVTCVVTGGGLGVFPNSSGMRPEDACASIGASIPEGGTPYGGLSAEQVRALDQEIASRYEATWNASGLTCRGADVLQRVITNAIKATGATAWKIEDVTSASGHNCATFTIDSLGARVLMIDAEVGG
jgi:hypothetical protein